MSRFRIVLGTAVVVLATAGVAGTALAGATDDQRFVREQPQQPATAQVTEPAGGPKWPGDPYVGKCVFWLKGANALQECAR